MPKSPSTIKDIEPGSGADVSVSDTKSQAITEFDEDPLVEYSSLVSIIVALTVIELSKSRLKTTNLITVNFIFSNTFLGLNKALPNTNSP